MAQKSRVTGSPPPNKKVPGPDDYMIGFYQNFKENALAMINRWLYITNLLNSFYEASKI